MILTKQDSDRIRISFFKNRIGSDSKIHYPIISGVQQRRDRIRITGVDSGRILRFYFGPRPGVKNL